VRRFGRFRRTFPNVAQKLYEVTQKRVFGEHYLGWIPAVVRTAVARHLRRPFDLVLATGNPFVSFAAARQLGKLFKVPYVVDFRDAWTFNQFTGELTFPEGGPMTQWEKKVVMDAAEVVFVNDGMRRWYADRYPSAAKRMQVVPNGWEPELLGRAEFRESDPNRPLRFSYLGTVTAWLPLEVLIGGWRLARSHPLLADAELDVHGHLGFFPDNALTLRPRLEAGADAGVVYRGAFAKTEASRLYAESDALVFCVPGAKFVTSGKVFEYMATGKPIVSVHESDIAATDVLEGYPLWFSGAKLNEENVAESFIAAAKAARDLDRPTFDAALRHADRYTRDATLAPWEHRLRALAGAAR
jgi:glycosyltransferase involved in cell wall biosynthesis